MTPKTEIVIPEVFPADAVRAVQGFVNSIESLEAEGQISTYGFFVATVGNKFTVGGVMSRLMLQAISSAVPAVKHLEDRLAGEDCQCPDCQAERATPKPPAAKEPGFWQKMFGGK